MTLAAIRDPFISPAHLTRPERWHLPEGTYTNGWLIAPGCDFNIRSQWQDPEILLLLLFCYKNILRKIRSHALVPKFRPDLFASLEDITEK